MQTSAAPATEHNLTDAQYKVLNHLIAGISIAEAARAAGVHRNTVTNWRRQVPAFAQLPNEAMQERPILFREEADEVSLSVRLRAALATAQKCEILHKPAQSSRAATKPQTKKLGIHCRCAL